LAEDVVLNNGEGIVENVEKEKSTNSIENIIQEKIVKDDEDEKLNSKEEKEDQFNENESSTVETKNSNFNNENIEI
jgi:hypothetical protein